MMWISIFLKIRKWHHFQKFEAMNAIFQRLEHFLTRRSSSTIFIDDMLAPFHVFQAPFV